MTVEFDAYVRDVNQAYMVYEDVMSDNMRMKDALDDLRARQKILDATLLEQTSKIDDFDKIMDSKAEEFKEV